MLSRRVKQRVKQRGKFALGGAFTFAIVCAAAFVFVQFRGSSTGARENATPSQVAVVAASPSSPTAPVATSIVWENSFESAMQRAQNERKPVMIDFYTDWCGVCKNVDAETYPNPAVIQKSQNFVMVKVDAESRTDLASRFNVNAYPTFVFTNSQGAVLFKNANGYSPQSLFN